MVSILLIIMKILLSQLLHYTLFDVSILYSNPEEISNFILLLVGCRCRCCGRVAE